MAREPGRGDAARGRPRSPCSRATTYSDWSSSPWLGTKPSRKCGNRSPEGPGVPSCSVELSQPAPGTGLRGPVGRRRAEIGRARVEPIRRLHPDLVDSALRPRREQADAVAAGEDLVEVAFDGRPWKVLEHVLAKLERGHDVERRRAPRAPARRGSRRRRRSRRRRDAACGSSRPRRRARAPRPRRRASRSRHPSRACRWRSLRRRRCAAATRGLPARGRGRAERC